jgi:hypothetical protein
MDTRAINSMIDSVDAYPGVLYMIYFLFDCIYPLRRSILEGVKEHPRGDEGGYLTDIAWGGLDFGNMGCFPNRYFIYIYI